VTTQGPAEKRKKGKRVENKPCLTTDSGRVVKVDDVYLAVAGVGNFRVVT
jgi:hypothetical protein